ncbi:MULTISPECIES: glyoxalase superfamily protein [Rhodococcus]|mgnify:FL=1|jgi:catechol 2,3-dioxygenase-like lactoylglutathione lyase family enzyme|uniref:Glyoxalase n=5 Tax=Rhodococcus erythropolis group TaxID=2840174 RepID=A0A0E4A559_RHOER|nr:MULTISPECIES: glyoxalase superfamily protein [Rhodococcus]EEN88340.1 glyoxalase family protein [Rhodococcus erythropolis SK121]ERB54043.1 glyoxalase [Rhodococcus sp. P27]MCD2156720.1 VOC family protein [Rhodococcus cerastii]NHE68240.1 glyoxalase [Rhodococcus sp. D-46]NHP15710.1 glyoxalase [Rhodococcus sp. IC4_135]OCC18737.1 glyoxalase [Prescottella equi]
MDIKLELVAIPVTDIDRAKDFYVRLGFNADHDHTVSEDLRFVQLTPPGSACSICIGKGITDAEPGSVVGMQVVVKDIEEAEREFKSRGIDISPIDDQAWGRFIYFADPDGNKWAVQEIVIPDLSGSNS